MQGLANNNNQTQNNRTSTIDVPVRILVPSESVGAIIGKGGQTIRQLTQQTRAKVDVYRGDPMAPATALQEKVITIRGQPENCINACREILKVMKVDAESKGKPSDTPLKVLAHNDYIGRIIGKQGNIINTIKKETETSVTVSSINDMSMNVERVITVKGELENMIKALEIIHSKVKSAFENDTKTYGAQAIMMGGLPPIPLAPSSFPTTPNAAAAVAAAAAAAAAFNAPPNSAVRFAAAAAAAAAQHPPHPHQGGNAHPAGLGNASGGVQTHNPHHPGSAPAGNNPQGSAAGGGPGAGAQSGAQGNYANYFPPLYHPHAPHHAHQHPGQSGAGVYGNPGAGLLPPQSHAVVSQHGYGPHGQAHGQHDLVNQGPEPETVYLYIPNVAVGAIIGTKGSYIKNIIKLSGASVKITPLTPEESKTVLERQVVIVGTPESQWKAQYYIYEKIRQERFTSDENVKLRAELQVPSHIVGRIIGKSGKNVRDLQKQTGATIKLPEDANLNQQQQQQNQQQAQDSASSSSNAANCNGTNPNSASPNEANNLNQSSSENQASSTTTLAPDAAATTTTTTPVTTTTTATTNNESGSNGTSTAATTTATTTTNNNNGKQSSPSPNPQSSSSSSGNATNANTSNNQSQNNQGFVVVRIYGTFSASQCAQRRIQQLVSQSLRGPIDGTNQQRGPGANMNPMLNNHQPGSMPISNHYHQRNDGYQHQPRANGGAYNRKNNRHHQHNQQNQQNQQNTSTNNGQSKDQQQQQQNSTTGKDSQNTSINQQQNNSTNGGVSSGSSSEQSTSSTNQQQQQQQQPQTPTSVSS